MRFRCGSEFCECRRIGCVGFPRSRHGLRRFQPAFAVFRPAPSPAHLRLRVHPLLSLPPLCSSSPLLPAHHRGAVQSFQGLLPPSRHKRAESTSDRTPTSCLCSALSVSHALDGLLLVTPCRPISSRCHVRDSLLRGFPRQSAVWLSPARSLLTFSPLACIEVALVAPAPGARLQGFDPTADPLRPRSGLDSPTLAPLTRFCSRRFFSEHLGDAFAPPPLVTFRTDASQWPRPSVFSVSIGVQPSSLSPDTLPD